MDARLTQAESAYLVSATFSAERERAMALRLAASEAYRAGLLRGATQLLARLGDALFGWVERARLRAELGSLTDRELADIGLSRGDIGRVVDASEPVAETAPTRRPARIGAQQAA
ncbi:DUF1127 domain-containing protein [Dankookia rubra]|uniref:DUF1127 domain-containing protein n=1 Tax=Dankookia rubra TaxID=1442381 RepID=A0A4R5QMI9_9PROT|nr:DUF1127 domain-containing protein [Dankookia rubra]TDH64496.1 DUF1127 domain-containing protein [Dankookia rubra]